MKIQVAYMVMATNTGAQVAASRVRALLQRVPTARTLRRVSRLLKQECFANVAACVQTQGGEPVYGWQVLSVCIDNLRGIDMETHCVWRMPSGALVEVTDGKDDWGFFEDEWVKDAMRDKGFTIAAVATREQAALIEKGRKIQEMSTRVIAASERGPVEVEPWEGWQQPTNW
jgi:hypothetical protein